MPARRRKQPASRRKQPGEPPPHVADVLNKVRDSPAASEAVRAAMARLTRAAMDTLSRKNPRTAAGRTSAVRAALEQARAVLDDIIRALRG